MRKNKVKMTVMVMLLVLCCVLVKTNVNANEKNNNKEVEQNVPRTLLKLTHTEEFRDGVEITINYSYQDSTNQIIGIDRVYVSAYSPAVYSSIQVKGFDILNDYNTHLHVKVLKTYANTANTISGDYYISIR